MGLQSSVNQALGSAESAIKKSVVVPGAIEAQNTEIPKAPDLASRQEAALKKIEEKRKAIQTQRARLEESRRVTKTPDGRVFLGGGGDF